MSSLQVWQRMFEEQKNENSRLFAVSVVFYLKTQKYELVVSSQDEKFTGFRIPVSKEQAEMIRRNARLDYEYHNEIFETLTYSNKPFPLG